MTSPRPMVHPRSKRILITLVALGSFAGAAAQAAPLTYSTAATINLTSPATTFTIAAGSVADTLQVNATSVIVTLTSSTGGTFTLTSRSYDLTIGTSGSGGTAPLSCTSGLASVTLSQATGATNYTITPTASQCTTPSNSGGSGGGGGSVSVSSGYGSPYIPSAGVSTSTQTATTTSMLTPAASSTAELETELNSLLALYENLLAQTKGKGMVIPGTGAGTHLFTTALHLGMSGAAVTYLQEFLAKNAAIYPEGRITSYFGTLTLKAVQRFQKKYGIAKAGDAAYGYVGPATRAKLNSLIGQGANP